MNTAELSINEWEALSFFGSDPISREYGTEWFDSDSVYEVVRGDLHLTCAIHPIHRDVRLILSRNGNRVFEWSAMDLIDICYIEEKERTVIRFISSTEDETVLRVSPDIEITRKSNGPNRVPATD